MAQPPGSSRSPAPPPPALQRPRLHPAADAAAGAALLVLDAAAACVALLVGLGHTDADLFADTTGTDWTPVASALLVPAALAGLSAWPLGRRAPLSAALQALAALALAGAAVLIALDPGGPGRR
ncbi:hypothetical protein C0216_15190 [Streptomyces globosus]|uniref:Uncharacterized protein n=1 Tax=Streptomyces globosus TaxID=68209 RepID=A0A344U158_9ACTN|nr:MULTISPECIES: hypothetical protein [Streptomyces]AXE24629.1 hypothetical protein C0216_15190 [Streptomyces globosus]